MKLICGHGNEYQDQIQKILGQKILFRSNQGQPFRYAIVKSIDNDFVTLRSMSVSAFGGDSEDIYLLSDIQIVCE